MTAADAIHDYIQFYLTPRVSSKTIELIGLKSTPPKKNPEKEDDELLTWVAGFRKTLKVLKKYEKELPHFTNKESAGAALDRGYLSMILMTTEDCLLMIGKERYQLTDHLMALILNKPEAHLEFKRKQMLRALTEKGETFAPTQTIHPSQFVPIQKKYTVFQRFRNLPFALRFSIETSVVLLTLISLMWIVPEIRNAYENSVQKKINDYLIESSLVDSPAPEGTSKTPKALPVGEAEPEVAAEPIQKEAENNTNRKQPKVNDGETWRFSFTGASTADLESGIIDILKHQGIESPKPLTVPGGIQFDFAFESQNLLNLKNAFEEMVNRIRNKSDPQAHTSGGSMNGANLSWYKKKNMGTRKIQPGHVQVEIWISTL